MLHSLILTESPPPGMRPANKMNRSKRTNDEDGAGEYPTPEGVISSSNVLVVGSTSDSDHPQKKQAITTLSCPSNMTSFNAENSSSVANFAVKSETSSACKSLPEPDTSCEELLLVWNIYGPEVEEEPTEHSISADQIVTQGLSFGNIPNIQMANKGEWGQRYYSLRLSRQKEEVAKLNFVWWEVSTDANLMNFNELSRDLEDFCFTLWCAAGRRRNQYDAFSIEMGSSKHSFVEVNDLIEDALDSENADMPEVTYLDINYHQLPVAPEHGIRLLNGLVPLIGTSSTLIAHDTDLMKLQVGYTEYNHFRLKALRKGRGQSDWYVRTVK